MCLSFSSQVPPTSPSATDTKQAPESERHDSDASLGSLSLLGGNSRPKASWHVTTKEAVRKQLIPIAVTCTGLALDTTKTRYSRVSFALFILGCTQSRTLSRCLRICLMWHMNFCKVHNLINKYCDKIENNPRCVSEMCEAWISMTNQWLILNLSVSEKLFELRRQRQRQAGRAGADLPAKQTEYA
jgi:hypothetical protein